MLKTIMLAAVSASAIALGATAALAQATPVYNSPAQARTDDTAPQAQANWDRRAVNRHRQVDAYAAESFGGYQQPGATNKHTVYIQDY